MARSRLTAVENKLEVTSGDRKVGRGKIGLGVKKSSGTEDVCEMKSYGNEDVCETCENCKALWHPLQCSCLENPMDGGAWKTAVHGVAEGRT